MIILFAVLLSIVILIDIYQTYKLFEISPDAEANPLLKAIYSKFSFTGVALFKLGVLLVLLLTFDLALYVAGFLFYLGIVLWNCYWFWSYNKEVCNGETNKTI